MPIDYERLMGRHFPAVEHAYDWRDTILYALGVGLGADPLDSGQLRFVYEDGLKVLPTMATVLGYPGFWMREPDTGLDWRRVVLTEQSIVIHRTLQPESRVVGHTRVSAIYDKGAEKGALVCQERRIVDVSSGDVIATVSQVNMCRGDGGFGGPSGSPPPPHPIPDRPADVVCELTTLPQAALIYRLSGDFNPLHADPAVAQSAGFSRPILHGLCSMGIACHAILRRLLNYDPTPLWSMRARFTAPALPGDTIRTELWRDDGVVPFRSTAVERNVMILGGRADLA